MDRFLWTKYFFVTCEKLVATSQFDRWTFIINAITAFATFASVVLTLYVTFWKKLVEKPSLKVEASEKAPNCIVVEDKIEVRGGKNQKLEICGLVRNEKEYIARDCRIVCKKICAKSACGEKYVECQQIRPFSFPWCDTGLSEDRVDISLSLQRYFKFAELSATEGENESAPAVGRISSSANGKSSTRQKEREKNSVTPPPLPLTLLIMSPDKINTQKIIPTKQENSSNDFLLVCSLVCLEKAPENFGIKIVWKGKSINDIKNKTSFQIVICSPKELKEQIEE